MSVFFVSSSNHTLWNPGNVSAAAFVGQVGVVAELVGVAAGLQRNQADEVIIDAHQFARFAAAFQQLMHETSEGSTVHSLLGGCFVVVAFLSNRIGAPLPLNDSGLADYEALVAKMLRANVEGN